MALCNEAFAEQLNLFKVGGYGINPMEKFSGTTADITLKITTHGAVQFMSWIQYCRAIYMDYPIGNPDRVQGSNLDTHHFMQNQ